MKEYIDWVEQAALENLRFRIGNAETLAREANSTLTVLLAGIGAGVAYVVKAFETGVLNSLAVSVTAGVAWLMLCAGVLVTRCILSKDLPVPTNEPENLWHPEWGLDVSRQSELNAIQERIDTVKVRNHSIAAWLDRVRVMAILSPFVVPITFLVWEYWLVRGAQALVAA